MEPVVLEAEELVKLVELPLMECQVLLERRESRGDVSDLPVEAPDVVRDRVDLSAEDLLARAGFCEPLMEVREPLVDLLLPIGGTGSERGRGENEREYEQGREPPHKRDRFGGATDVPVLGRLRLRRRVRLGNLRRRGWIRLTRRRVRLRNLRRRRRVELARRRVRLGNVRLCGRVDVHAQLPACTD